MHHALGAIASDESLETISAAYLLAGCADVKQIKVRKLSLEFWNAFYVPETIEQSCAEIPQ